jgi:hypothetical protein
MEASIRLFENQKSQESSPASLYIADWKDRSPGMPARRKDERVAPNEVAAKRESQDHAALSKSNRRMQQLVFCVPTLSKVAGKPSKDLSQA